MPLTCEIWSYSRYLVSEVIANNKNTPKEMFQPDHSVAHTTQQLNTSYEAFSVSLFLKASKG